MQSNFGYEKMRSKRKEFRVGDMVIWEKPINKARRLLIASYKKEYGSGPFLVAAIKKVPRGDSRRSVGHHQYLWLKDIDGPFSGAHLRLSRTLKKRT